MGGGNSKPCTPLQCMIKNFKAGFSRDYGGDDPLEPDTLTRYCTLDWPIQSPTWPTQGSFDIDEIRKVHISVTKAGVKHPDQYPYIDQWMLNVVEEPSWLRRYKERKKQATTVLAIKVKGKKGKIKSSMKAPKQTQWQIPKTFMEPLPAKAEEPIYDDPLPQEPDEDEVPPPYNPGYRSHRQGPVTRQAHIRMKEQEKARAEAPTPLYPDLPDQGKDIAEFEQLKKEQRRIEREIEEIQDADDKKGLERELKKVEKAMERLSIDGMGEAAKQLPLRVTRFQAEGPTGQSIIRTQIMEVPFSTTDLINWKRSTKPLSENPGEMGALIETIVKTHKPSWQDMQTLLTTLFTSEERDRIRQAMKDVAKADNPTRDAVGLEELTPQVDQGWDPHTVDGETKREAYCNLFIRAVKKAGQKNTNLGKISEVIQGLQEPPGAFMERLKEAYKMWSNIDPDDPANRRQVNTSFISQAAKDIRRKLQKKEEAPDMSEAMLVGLARRVFMNRDTEEEKTEKTCKLMVAAVRGDSMRSRGIGRGRGRGRGGSRGGFPGERIPLNRDQCALCRQHGHWKRECPRNQGTNVDQLALASEQ